MLITFFFFFLLFRVIGFDHRKSVLAQITNDHPDKVKFYVDLEKSSSTAAYEYFSSKLVDLNSPDVSRCEIMLFCAALVYCILCIDSSNVKTWNCFS